MNKGELTRRKRSEPTGRTLPSQLVRHALRLLLSGLVLTSLLLIAAVPTAFLCVGAEKDPVHAWALMVYLTAVALAHATRIEPLIGRLVDSVGNSSSSG